MPMRFKDKIEGTITNADYASSAGSATTASKLGTNAGGSTTPVYFSNGVPVALGYTIQSSVPANAKFTDTNTTYGVFKAATSSAAGGTGLVPAPAAGAQAKYLRADGTWSSPPNDNTTYSDFTGATADAAGAHGLVPAPAKGQQNYFLRGDKTWQALSKSSVGLGNVDNTADANKSVKSATTATSATNDSKSQAITGYIRGLSVSGRTITYTKGDGTTGTLTTQDTNTTYGVFGKATADAAGSTGLVPAPAKGDQSKFLRADGTWVVPTNTTYSAFKGATSSAAGGSGLVPAPGSNVLNQYLKSTGAWGQVAWGEISGKPSTFAPATHTHNYAGSSSAGGSATSAVKLDTATAGSNTQPVYFSGGKPVAIGYTIQSNVPANAKFTDTNTDTKVTQSAVTASDYTNWRTLIWGASNSGTEGFAPTTVTDSVFSTSVFSCQPSTGTIKATTFKGALSGNASTATALTSNAGSATQPVYFTGGKPTACTYTLGKSVPSNAVFTDTNTWRGIQDNLTSTATDQSLSANQGKVLKGLVDGKAASSHTHTSVNDINDGGATTFAYSKSGLGYDNFTWVAAWNGKELRAVNKNVFAQASHSHSYLPLSGGTVTGATTFSNTTASTSKSTGAVKVSGGLGVAGRMSANEVMIGDGCTLTYDATNKCVNFVFS